MQAWEVIVIVAGCCLAAVTTYLIMTLRKLTGTLSKVDKILDDNTGPVSSIVGNVDDMAADARNIVGSVAQAADGIKNAVKPKTDSAASLLARINLPAIIAFAASAYSTFKALKAFSDKKKEKAANKEGKKDSK